MASIARGESRQPEFTPGSRAGPRGGSWRAVHPIIGRRANRRQAPPPAARRDASHALISSSAMRRALNATGMTTSLAGAASGARRALEPRQRFGQDLGQEIVERAPEKLGDDAEGPVGRERR